MSENAIVFTSRKKTMVDIVIAVCEFLGPAAVVAIGITLLLIAMEKIKV